MSAQGGFIPSGQVSWLNSAWSPYINITVPSYYAACPQAEILNDVRLYLPDFYEHETRPHQPYA